MATFNFSTAIARRWYNFIFRSWICVANGQGGFHSHLADAIEPKIDQLGVPDSATELADNLSKILFSDLLEELSSNDQENIQSKIFFDLEKDLDDSPSADATNFWEAPNIDELPKTEPISIIGQHLDFTVASTPQGHFMYYRAWSPRTTRA